MVALLRDRCELLEEQVRQLQQLLAPPELLFSPVPSVHLSPHEARLFAHLISREFATKTSCFAAMFGLEGEQNPKNLDVHICKLRAKLDGAGVVIDTLWGQGYRLRNRGKWRALVRQAKENYRAEGESEDLQCARA